ncbi:MAG: dihydropteroate synthase, partial [Acidocella sp. 20-61-6]
MNKLQWAGLDLSTPKVMGILNVTPDSFSDGGKFVDAEAAIARGREMLAAGADILDVGGESTRPGAAVISTDEEMARILPVLQALAGEAVISVDTRNGATMAAALEAGARIINDVSGLRHDPKA